MLKWETDQDGTKKTCWIGLVRTAFYFEDVMIKRLFRSLIILALFLGGCESSSSPQPAIIPTISPTGTFTPSATIAPQASLTPSLTLTPTPTSTFYPQPGQVLEPGNAGQIR